MNYCQFRNDFIKRMANVGGEGLPAEYQQVEYLQSSGTQHIVTNVPIAAYVETRCKGMLLTGSVLYSALVGGRNSDNSSGRYIPLSNTDAIPSHDLRFVYDGKEYSSTTGAYNILYEIIFNDANKNVYCNNELIGSFAGYTLSTAGQQNIALFGMSGYNGSKVDWKVKGRLYYASFYNNQTGEKLGDYIPCYRKSDNKPGMYDIVTNTFFTNAGTGEFTVGNPV